jgi:hypothetical protein
VGEAIKLLRGAFPKMGDDFFRLLYKRIGDNEFSARRVGDAVNHVIDNFRYKELNVADIISFDKRVKLYNYHEKCTEVGKGANWDDFEPIRVPGRDKPYFIKTVDKENANYDTNN